MRNLDIIVLPLQPVKAVDYCVGAGLWVNPACYHQEMSIPRVGIEPTYDYTVFDCFRGVQLCLQLNLKCIVFEELT